MQQKEQQTTLVKKRGQDGAAQPGGNAGGTKAQEECRLS